MLATGGQAGIDVLQHTPYGAAKLPGEVDGPEQFHVVLLDNGRAAVLADAEQRDRCIAFAAARA